MSTSDRIEHAAQRTARAKALVPSGCHPVSQRLPVRRNAKHSFPSINTDKAAEIQRKTTTAVSERNLPIRTQEMGETASESGRLQKIRSTRERCRKRCRLRRHATRYPGQTTTGMNAGTASRLSKICVVVMFEPGRIPNPLGRRFQPLLCQPLIGPAMRDKLRGHFLHARLAFLAADSIMGVREGNHAGNHSNLAFS
jgi:hypothetical protein